MSPLPRRSVSTAVPRHEEESSREAVRELEDWAQSERERRREKPVLE